VLLSTGAWGTATGIAKTARLLDNAGYLPVVLCADNQRLRSELSKSPHAVALGWVDDMPGLMAASRVLIDNAAGQTAQEALAAGLPVVGYRPIPGHGTEGVRRMADLGLSDHAGDPRQLLRSLGILSEPGQARERRIARARAIFAADSVTYLEALRRSPGPGARDPGASLVTLGGLPAGALNRSPRCHASGSAVPTHWRRSASRPPARPLRVKMISPLSLARKFWQARGLLATDRPVPEASRRTPPASAGSPELRCRCVHDP
jgi:hypothetical protein